MLTVTGLQKRFGGQIVLDSVNWFVPSNGRVALVGANGSGKSTFLRMIARHAEPDAGSINLPKGATIGYLQQEVFGLSERSVMEETLSAFAHLHEIEDTCRRLEHEMSDLPADDPRHDEVMQAYSEAREAWDAHGSYDLDSRTENVLTGLGFSSADFTRSCTTFSGGWQMRIALAKLLLQQPSLLLLDEPTNHLDLEARNWLEDFLRTYPGSVILVAHDRYFLDQTVNHVSELSRGKLTDFDCNYSRYLEEKVERQQLQEQAYRLQQEEIERIEAFVSRFRAQASKAALVQSRIKQLEKIERLSPPEGMRTVHFRFPQPERSGRMVLEMQGAAKSYGDICVYRDATLAIERGKKVALVGPNGAGKSTLMRMMAGTEPLDSGERRAGHNVQISYFAQDRGASLDPDRSVLETVTSAAPMDLVPYVRGLLGSFLFSGDAVHKKVRVLSGGERSRLALALLLLRPTNCLLLDEPTNHLDLAAKEVLLGALQGYNGTLIFVAHDRYFLDHLPSEVLEAGHGTTTSYLGDYHSYLAKKEAELVTPAAPVVATRPTVAAPPPSSNGAARDREAEKKVAKEKQKRERELAALMQEIEGKETTLGEMTQLINDPNFYMQSKNPQATYSEFAKLKDEIAKLYTRMERLGEE